jgi:hypothetical protein
MKRNDSPTKEQMDMIDQIARSSGLFSCRVPKTQAEADDIIMDFIQPFRRIPRPKLLDWDKLFPVEEKP